MKELHEYNTNFVDEDFGPTSKKRKAEAPQNWAGSATRIMLQLMFITAMLVLLRFEEVLRITWNDVQFQHDEHHPRRLRRVRLMLPFRKTHQYGGASVRSFRNLKFLTPAHPTLGILPFYLYENSEKHWMCPVRAWAAWWQQCRKLNLDMNGYVFRKKMGSVRVLMMQW